MTVNRTPAMQARATEARIAFRIVSSYVELTHGSTSTERLLDSAIACCELLAAQVESHRQERVVASAARQLAEQGYGAYGTFIATIEGALSVRI